MPRLPGVILSAPYHNPLAAVLIEENGRTETRYFIDDLEADALPRDEDTVSPIKLAGIWDDLDAEDMLDTLDRARHASRPTPPIDDIP